MLRKDETAAGQTYKYAKVVKVHASTDNKVRAAHIEYKLPGESVFRTTTRPIHKLVLVIPVEEQNPEADADKMREMSEPVKDGAAEATAGASGGKGGQTASQAVPEGEGGGSPTKVKTVSLEKEVETSQSAPAPKKKEATQRRNTFLSFYFLASQSPRISSFPFPALNKFYF